MGTKLFVGKLSYDTTEEGLTEFFSPYGPLESVSIIKDRGTNMSKGFAFIEIADLKSAQKAISELDGKQLDGRTIVVNAAKPPQPREGGFRQGGQRRSW